MRKKFLARILVVVCLALVSGTALAGTPGTKKWEFNTGGLVDSSPAIGPDGTIYVGSGSGKLYAVDPHGNQKWEFNTGGLVFSSPALGPDGTVYVGSVDGKLYAVNPDGRQKWAFYTGGLVDFGTFPSIRVSSALELRRSRPPPFFSNKTSWGKHYSNKSR